MNGPRAACFALLLLPFAAPAQSDPPSAAERDKILKTVGEFARGYIEHLPDFVCVRETQHFTRNPKSTEWTPQVKIAEELTYYKHEEHYKIVAVNDSPASRVPRHTSWSGFVHTSGNFGPILEALFEPESHATFEWKNWETLRDKPAWVFSYRMPSGFTSKWCRGVIIPVCKTANYPYHGLIYVSRDHSEVMRITVEPENAPPRDSGSSSVDYDRVSISGADYLLPIADTYERLADKTYLRNESVYRDYRKFAAESTIKVAPDDHN